MQPALLVLLAIGGAMGLPSLHIVGGIEAAKGEFPHIVQIQLHGGHVCGGSIVNANWIVTAAHCIDFWRKYTIVAGEHDLLLHEGTEQPRNVSEIKIHPDYDFLTSQANDIALMKVSPPFTLNDHVKAANLASFEFTPMGPLTAAGWGRLSEKGKYSTVLMKVDVPFVTTANCSEIYPQQIFNDMLCAGGDNGKDACKGDSGGPLMSGSTLVGITSWGRGCASGFPGVYSSVSYFNEWIQHYAK